MTFDELIRSRYSCRKFKADKIDKELILAVLEAGRVAPTAVNRQPQRIFVIESESGLKKVNECTKYGFDAPVNFLICYDKDAAWHRRADNKDHGDIDAAIVTTHMMLKAWELGLGTTWVCAMDADKTREVFNIPDNYEIMGFLPMGIPADDAKPAQFHFERNELNVEYL